MHSRTFGEFYSYYRSTIESEFIDDFTDGLCHISSLFHHHSEGNMRHYLLVFVISFYVKHSYVFVDAFCRSVRLERTLGTTPLLMSVDSALLGPRALDLEYSNGIRLMTGVYSFSWISPDVPSPAAPTRAKAQIDLYSMLHIGDKSYYDEISNRMQAYDVVLYELITDTKNCVQSEGKDYKRQLTKEIYSKVTHPYPYPSSSSFSQHHHPVFIDRYIYPSASSYTLLSIPGREQPGFELWSGHPGGFVQCQGSDRQRQRQRRRRRRLGCEQQLVHC